MKTISTVALATMTVFFAALAAPAAWADCPTQFAPLAEHAPLQIDTRHGKRRFIIEVARTSDQQERGLMCRAHLDADKGMIFPMSPPRPAAFWMKNTMIPLDIIFVTPEGRIESIKRRAKPYDLTPLASGGSVNAVLELGGGVADRLGIREGDRVVWPAKR